MLATLIRQSKASLRAEWSRPLLRSSARRVFPRKITVDFEARGYRVKTIDTRAEMRQVLALRRSVFHYEFARKWISLSSDRDAFDDRADHLAIISQETGKIVGVYRLIVSGPDQIYYSNTEFDITRFLKHPGRKVELSRACIDRDYRTGTVIALLWKGLAEYAKTAEADYLFGLSSVTTTDKSVIKALHQHFEGRGIVDSSFGMDPRPEFVIDGFAGIEAAPGDTSSLIPPLLKTYIKAGAKICSQPVIDRDFNCADWLTVLDMRELTAAFDRRFMKDGKSLS
jgi:putative hemolysin